MLYKHNVCVFVRISVPGARACVTREEAVVLDLTWQVWEKNVGFSCVRPALSQYHLTFPQCINLPQLYVVSQSSSLHSML